MTRRHRLLVVLLLLIFTACTGVPEAGQTAAPLDLSAMYPGDDDSAMIQLGYHYKPPRDDTDVRDLADQAAFVILTKNDELYRDSLREAGYAGQILEYVLAAEVDAPPLDDSSDDCDATYKPWQNQAANQPGDFCNLIHPHEDWFLHNSEGERLYNMIQDRRYYHMDPGSEGWRAFLLQRLKQRIFGDATTPPLGYDGVFLDNVELTRRKVLRELENSDGTLQEYATDAAYRAAWIDLLAFLRNGLGTSVPLWANMIAESHTPNEWNEYLPYLDGGMNEAFVTGYRRNRTPQEQNSHLQQAEYVLSQGKGFYAVSQGSESDTERQQFALASYLLIAQPDAPSFFRYTRADEDYDLWWRYDNYELALGSPKGPRYAVEDGWRRDFTHGYVVVDQVRHRGEIILHTTAAPEDRGAGSSG
jgi:hypothetical protein